MQGREIIMCLLYIKGTLVAQIKGNLIVQIKVLESFTLNECRLPRQPAVLSLASGSVVDCEFLHLRLWAATTTSDCRYDFEFLC